MILVQSPGVEDFFENNDPTSLSTWMKMRNRVYDDRKKRVEQICRQMNVTSSSIKNSFDDAYSKVVDKDSGKYNGINFTNIFRTKVLCVSHSFCLLAVWFWHKKVSVKAVCELSIGGNFIDTFTTSVIISFCVLTVGFCNFLAQGNQRKSLSLSVGEIEYKLF